jgi:hypothetical protein
MANKFASAHGGAVLVPYADNGDGTHSPVTYPDRSYGRTRFSKHYSTTTATTAAVHTPTTGKRVVITALTVSVGGTTAGKVTLWFGASGDSTYDAGTDQPVTVASFAPSASSAPGMVISLSSDIVAASVNHVLKATTSAAMTVDIVVHGYEVD